MGPPPQRNGDATMVGCTACVCCVTDSQIITANAGDRQSVQRAVFITPCVCFSQVLIVLTSRSICLGHDSLSHFPGPGPRSLVLGYRCGCGDGAVWMQPCFELLCVTKAAPCPVKLPCQSGRAVQWRRGNCIE